MLYVRLEKQIVELPAATDYRHESDEVEFVDPEGSTIARCFAGDIRGVSPDKFELVEDLLEEAQEDQPTPPEWDGS